MKPRDYGIPVRHLKGIGTHWTNGCFVCGGKCDGLYNSVTLIVDSTINADKLCNMFTVGAKSDVTPYGANNIQVFIGGCDVHLPHLYYLYLLAQSGMLNASLIELAQKFDL